MESWMILGIIAVIVAEILCCSWSIFFQWYRRKREREGSIKLLQVAIQHMSNELQLQQNAAADWRKTS